jgi:hypothetical protein
MSKEQSHPSDQALVAAADGELSAHHSSAIRAHLDFCGPCRVRMDAFENAAADLKQLHQHDHDLQFSAVEGRRSLLRARLAQAAVESRTREAAGILSFGSWGTFNRYGLPVAACMLLCVFAIGVRMIGNRVQSTPFETAVAPKHHLTPGATVPLTKEDVCRSSSFPHEPELPTSLKRQVFQEYGITDPETGAYELDYLITPELGGATSIRNLWPQPYHNTAWHAGVKDQLEERLHTMVCNGQIDLATAQHDIATDWISAYKKYFHTDRPLMGRPKANNRTFEPEFQEVYWSQQQGQPSTPRPQARMLIPAKSRLCDRCAKVHFSNLLDQFV